MEKLKKDYMFEISELKVILEEKERIINKQKEVIEQIRSLTFEN